MTSDSASFRHPAGQVQIIEDRDFCSFQHIAVDDYVYVRHGSALRPLIENALVPGGEESDPCVYSSFVPYGGAVLDHLNIGFGPCPYEWYFGARNKHADTVRREQVTVAGREFLWFDRSD